MRIRREVLALAFGVVGIVAIMYGNIAFRFGHAEDVFEVEQTMVRPRSQYVPWPCE